MPMLREADAQLKRARCLVLSPVGIQHQPIGTIDGLLALPGDEGLSSAEIERRHLAAIEVADFVWLHCPDGYIGPSVGCELGVAVMAGVPVYSLVRPHDSALGGFVQVVESLDDALEHHDPLAPPRTLRALQAFYSRVSVERGYARENATSAFLCMVEELGELARELNVERGHKPRVRRPPRKAAELADLFLTLLHFANQDGHRLEQAVRDKIAAWPPPAEDR